MAQKHNIDYEEKPMTRDGRIQGPSRRYRRLRHPSFPAADWTAKNPLLQRGEMGIEIDTHRAKLGDGHTYWNDLPYSNVSQWGELTGDISNQTDLQEALDAKQDVISDLDTIRSNASAGAGAATTIAGYGDIVTHNASEFLTPTDIATPETMGIAKLYTSTGTNTDGSMDQNSITTALNDKQDVISAGNGIAIDDNVISTNTQFVITEDMFDIEFDDTKGVAPYSTSYGYTNVTIHDDAGIEWVEGAMYSFVLNTKVSISANRNVRVRIGEDGDWKPVMVTSSIASGASVFVKAVNSVFFYKTTYQANGALHCLYDTNTTYTINYSIDAGQKRAGTGAYAVSRYSLIMEKPDGTWEKITDTSKTYSTGTSKTVNKHGFLLNQIKYYNYTTNYANGALISASYVYSKSASANGSYSFNCGTAPGWAIGTIIYLVGTVSDSDGLFYLDETQWWATSLPTSKDGKLYIQLGVSLSATDSTFSFWDDRPVFYYDNGIKLYGGASEWGKIGGTLSNQTDLKNKLLDTTAVFRGRFNTWNDVPTTASYTADSFDETTPINGNFIFVTDASGYSKPAEVEAKIYYGPSGYRAVVTSGTTVQEFELEIDAAVIAGPADCLRIVRTETTQYGSTYKVEIFANVNCVWANEHLHYANSKIHTIYNVPGEDHVSTTEGEYRPVQVNGQPAQATEALEGAWIFKYNGTWNIDGKNGWKTAFPVGTGSGAEWGKIEGTLANQTDLQNALNGKQNSLPDGTAGQILKKTADGVEWADESGGTVTDVQVDGTTVVSGGVANVVISGKQDITDNTLATVSKTVVGAINEIKDKVTDIEAARFVDATIIGEPTIVQGQVSGFSTMSYLQFPFVLDLHDKAFDIYMCFTTADNVQTQQNILDSKFGLALAIQNGKGVMAISSNGTSWDIGSTIGTINIEANTTYYAKLSWDRLQYKTFLSTDGVNYTQDMVLTGAGRPFPTTIFIGGCNNTETGHTPHPFLGTINMNKARVDVMGVTIWQGMGDIGLATKANVSLDNLDATGEARFTAKQDKATYDSTNEELILP